MAKQPLWCEESVVEEKVVDGFYSPSTRKCMKPVVKGTAQCAEHQIVPVWPGDEPVYVPTEKAIAAVMGTN